MINFHKAITTVMGLGYAPIAPGTFGTIGAVLFYYLLTFAFPLAIPAALLVALAIFFTLLGTWSTAKVIPLWGEDPSKVVMDEFVGYLITMVLVPISLKYMIIGFVLFRFFDILKPLGVRYIDLNIKGAWGVMLDDVLAGIYACLTLHLYITKEPIILSWF